MLGCIHFWSCFHPIVWVIAACWTIWTCRRMLWQKPSETSVKPVLDWLLLSEGATRIQDGVQLRVHDRDAIVEAVGGFGAPTMLLRVFGAAPEEQLARIQQLLRTRGVKRVRCEAGFVELMTPSLAPSLGAATEGERLLRLLEQVVMLTPTVEEVLTVKPLDVEVRCPYCHDEISEAAERTLCGKCGSAHHSECYSEHGTCAIFGCGTLRRAA